MTWTGRSSCRTGAAARTPAWLIIVGQPTRPIPHSAPRLSREAAKAIIDSANNNPVITFQTRTPVLGLLGAGNGYVTVALNAWVVTNRAREGEQRMMRVQASAMSEANQPPQYVAGYPRRDRSCLGPQSDRPAR